MNLKNRSQNHECVFSNRPTDLNKTFTVASLLTDLTANVPLGMNSNKQLKIRNQVKMKPVWKHTAPLPLQKRYQLVNICCETICKALKDTFQLEFQHSDAVKAKISNTPCSVLK